MKADSVIFDLDGTLWDSADTVAESWSAALKKLGTDRVLTAEDMYREMGKPMDVIMADLFPELDRQRQLEIMPALCEEENELLAVKGGKLFPGVRETLEALKRDYRLFIVSNCQQGYIEAFLSSHSLESLFEGHLCWGDTGLSKGGTNRELIAGYGLNAPVYVGDTEGDRLSAAEAGIPFVFAAYGFGEVSVSCPRAESFPQLPEVISGINVKKGDTLK